jgi:hypothetical protein
MFTVYISYPGDIFYLQRDIFTKNVLVVANLVDKKYAFKYILYGAYY